jgi:hypothetical protein
MGHLLGLQAADACAHRASDAVGVGRDVDAGAVDRMTGGGQREVHEAIGAACRPPVDVLERIEALHHPRHPDGALEAVHAGDTGVPLTHVLPGLVDVEPAGRDGAHARDHYPSSFVAVLIAHIPSPPSTARTSPVMKAAESDTRNRTALATSAGSPSLPSGVPERIASRAGSGSTSVSSVEMYPGAIALTRIPLLPSSFASDLVSPIRPALEAA